ncbi:hypothetical protein [Pseudoneobacillus rhizosphaerae]|uniref:Uncharacterized protein n=1 Tax=Pseudoneobacillus rhizosphaerae TaxID=2880968 RepID=A0A9C7G7C6_9BACI|nr:hypothetical protein [Pseudoneobacillus rhizosphaerae]CAG9606908.1 hypothetical protein NEOCIP111885_00596 [Pseudoneobacillus rhizosphaerae]
MSELKLRAILGDIKSKKPQKRFQAIHKLHEFEQNIGGKELSIYLLNDVIKTAAHPFAEPIADWDQPCYFLLKFVSDYKELSLTKTIIRFYPNFSPAGKNIALNFLCEFGEENCRQAILNIYEEELKTGEAIFPISGLYDQPLWLVDILTRFSKELFADSYRNDFYQALSFSIRKGLISDFKTETITLKLVEDYERILASMQDYFAAYSTKAVYMSWKGNYLRLRDQLNLYLSLMEYYYSNKKTENLIKDALAFPDPTIQVTTIRVALVHHIPVDKEILQRCAENIETSEMLYHELEDINKESLYPIKEKKQHWFAKNHLFQHLLDETDYEDFPSEMVIVDSVETENYYGQPIRFYLVSFSADGENPLIGWVGAYSLEAGDDTIYMWEGTYTDFERFDDRPIEEHIEIFMKKREKNTISSEKEVYVEYKPRFSAVFQGFCAIIILQWIGALASPGNMVFLLPLTLVALVLFFIKIIEKKNYLVRIEGHKLVYQTRKHTYEIPLHEIKSLKVTKSKIEVYSRENQIVFNIKKNHVNEKQFVGLIEALTNHLKEPAIILN